MSEHYIPELRAEFCTRAVIDIQKDEDGDEMRATHRIMFDWAEVASLVVGGYVPIDPTPDEDWCGGGEDTLLSYVRKGGPPEIVAESERLLARVSSELHLPTPGPRVDLGLVGGIPHMGLALRGSPACMLGISGDSLTNTGLVRVICDSSTSASIRDDLIFKRAAVVTALVRSLSMYRPVEFWIGSCGKVSKDTSFDTAAMVRVSAHPVDISAVAAAMSQVFSRLFCYAVEYAACGCVSHSQGGGLMWPSKSVDECLTIADGRSHDIIVPPIHSNESEAFLQDPVEWVKEQVELAVVGAGLANAHGAYTC